MASLRRVKHRVSGGSSSSARLDELAARVDHLNAAVEGLQASFEQLHSLIVRTDPELMASVLDSVTADMERLVADVNSRLSA